MIKRDLMILFFLYLLTFYATENVYLATWVHNSRGAVQIDASSSGNEETEVIEYLGNTSMVRWGVKNWLMMESGDQDGQNISMAEFISFSKPSQRLLGQLLLAIFLFLVSHIGCRWHIHPAHWNVSLVFAALYAAVMLMLMLILAQDCIELFGYYIGYFGIMIPFDIATFVSYKWITRMVSGYQEHRPGKLERLICIF